LISRPGCYILHHPADRPIHLREETIMVFGTGNTGSMLVATSLVMLMTPRLAFFHGGLVGRKNVLGIMIIDKITPVKVTAEEESLGLDSALHGEEAYLQD
jgi:ammonia channel protein AmtB